MNKAAKIKSGHVIVLLTWSWIVATKPVYAYLDPGSGSYLIQVIIASLVAGSVMISSSWQKIKGSLNKIFKKKTSDEGKSK